MTIADASTIVPGPPSASSDIATETDGEAAAPPEGVLGRGAIVGRYVVLDELGAGAMGRVYSAYDPQLDRKVALKLLRSHPAFAAKPERAQQRLLREAQALAKLAHPNVVAVHDVQTLEGGLVAVAMEYVEGRTLRAWSLAARRTWREVLPVFVAAGRGLAAAHRAGVVHRDFKPDNVMIGDDGRARVLDFGLARADAPSSESDAATPAVAATTSFSGAESQNVETVGIAGTPAYMAPELFGGHSADPRSDQFAFCVALYEALQGRRPFRGDSLAALTSAAASGVIEPPQREAGVPGWVHRIVVRGLQPDPQQRHADMDTLVELLARDPAVARRRTLVASAAVVAVLLGGGALASALRPPDPCSDGDESLAAAWNDDRRDEVRNALAATGAAWHEELWQRASARLDARATELAAMVRENCLATRVRGEQSEQLQDTRAACLAHRRRELVAVVDRLAAADAAVAEHGVELLELLGPIEACADIDALLAGVRPPEDPGVRARVDELRETLTAAETLERSGKFTEALALVEPVRDEAATLDYPPLVAEAMYQLGELQDESGQYAIAETTLSEASWLAQRVHHDEIAARAAAEVVYVVGHHLRRYDDAFSWVRHAEAAVARFGDPLLAAHLEGNRGFVLDSAGRYEAAEKVFRSVLAERERLLEPDHPDVLVTMSAIASTLEDLGRELEAVEMRRDVFARYERLLGPDHPTVGNVLVNLALSEAGIGQAEAALAHARRAEAIFRASLPPDHPHIAAAMSNSILALWMLDRYPEARAIADERLAMLKRTLGPDHPDVGEAHATIGALAFEMEEFAVAREHMTLAVENLEHALGPDHPDLVVALNNLGTANRDSGDPGAALAIHERALAILEKAGLEDTDDMALMLRSVGLDEAALGRHADAIVHYRRSLATFADRPASQDQVARSHLEIARSEWALGRHETAIASARDGLRSCPRVRTATVCDDLAAWLADHRV
ncbi:MAG TPA: serine/threonine-protein kinase [Nannocystaceae bacterium]|nr:serine/threonine-protein kinase [Nannocystaceae bacterium]